jgi:uncharacterized repeat protein (TIGR04076 family)
VKRRNFLGSATLVPAPAPKQTTRFRMTVLKRTVQQEFQKYRNGEIQICDAVKDGQQFNIEYPQAKPEGICGWAWDDLQKSFRHLATRGSGQMVACCSDGFRPVYFLIEKVV